MRILLPALILAAVSFVAGFWLSRIDLPFLSWPPFGAEEEAPEENKPAPQRMQGFWGRPDLPRPSTSSKSKEVSPALKDLANLPYLRGFKQATEIETITIYDAEKAENGLNLVLSAHAPEALLQDMKGDTLHRWSFRCQDIWKGPLGFLWEAERQKEYWQRAYVFPNGDLLAIYAGIGMIKIDVDSNLLWSYEGRCHHDLFVDTESGKIYTLTRDDHPSDDRVKFIGRDMRLGQHIREDYVTVLTSEGVEIKTVSLFDCLLNSEYAALLPTTSTGYDILHANSIEILEGRFEETRPMLRKGHALISLRNNSMVVIVDLEEEKVTWALANGMWLRQHFPSVVGDGNILLFDNLGARSSQDVGAARSKVIEFNPLTHEVVWSYEGNPEDPFLSPIVGACTRLPGGNTLITDSVNGRAFEVTPEGEKVWQYNSPHRAGENGELVATLSEVVRIPEGYLQIGDLEERARRARDVDDEAARELIERVKKSKKDK